MQFAFVKFVQTICVLQKDGNAGKRNIRETHRMNSYFKYLIFVFLFLSTSAFSQPYLSLFGRTSTSWDLGFLVDSVYYLGTLKHVRLTASAALCNQFEQITFIEGSGTTAGLDFQGNFYDSMNHYMLCQHKDGQKVAGNLLFNDTCYL